METPPTFRSGEAIFARRTLNGTFCDLDGTFCRFATPALPAPAAQPGCWFFAQRKSGDWHKMMQARAQIKNWAPHISF